jgi:predicted transcriptional regulator
MKKVQKELTRAEEEVMQVLWRIGKGFVNDILAEFPEPRPAYNTISTIIRILERKGVVAYESFGKSHRYFPLVQRDAYARQYLKGFVKRYFSNSYQNMASFFLEKEDVSVEELELLRRHIDQALAEKKDRQ